jgi:hypothetical protein
MPGFDGTGPAGRGPFTGRGEGYCAVPLDRAGARPVVGRFRPWRWARWLWPPTWFGRRRFLGRGSRMRRRRW